MNEIRDKKIDQAREGMVEVFERLELSMREIEIITWSGYVAAQKCREMEGDEEKLKEEAQSKAMTLTTITSMLALAISTINLILSNLK